MASLYFLPVTKPVLTHLQILSFDSNLHKALCRR